MISLGKRFRHPTNRCYIFKAIDEEGEILGWCLVKWEDGSGYAPPTPAVSGGSGAEGEGRKESFVEAYTRDVRWKWDGIVGGKAHVGSFPPLPLR